MRDVTPLPVRRALAKLGSDLRDARRRRRIPTAVLADRVGISRPTLAKAERGDAGVSIRVYATILFSLGLVDRVRDLADVRADTVGLALSEDALPKRIRLRKTRAARETL